MQAKEFNKAAFEGLFAAALVKLAASENITKETMRPLSRELLEATHATGDIQYVNKTLAVLSPVNRKAAVVFFKHFTGFSYDDSAKLFVKKSKKRYEKAHADTVAFLADPLNNIWTWAERHIDVQIKPYTFESLTESVKHIMARAQHAGLSQADVVKAALKGGMTVDTIIAVLAEVEGYEVKITADDVVTDAGRDMTAS